MARWRGLSESLDALDDLGDATSLGMRAVLRREGEAIMTDVKASRPGKGVPVDRGNLRASGRVEGPTTERGRPVVKLTFGGTAAPYALVQHERLDFTHTVGEARYLTRALERRQQGGTPEEALRDMLESAQRIVKVT